MKNLWKKWILLAQFHFQDPDPDSEYWSGSGSRLAIWIRIHLDPDPKHWLYLYNLDCSPLYSQMTGEAARVCVWGVAYMTRFLWSCSHSQGTSDDRPSTAHHRPSHHFDAHPPLFLPSMISSFVPTCIISSFVLTSMISSFIAHLYFFQLFSQFYDFQFFSSLLWFSDFFLTSRISSFSLTCMIFSLFLTLVVICISSILFFSVIDLFLLTIFCEE